MKIIGIIPARYASTRFPGKPLINIEGKTMIRRVYEQAKKSEKLFDVIVATDDERISEEIKNTGGKVMMTASHHQSGTDRCYEIAQQINADAYINIQGDEPFIQPEQIDLLAKKLEAINADFAIATLIKKIAKNDEQNLLKNPNVIKVVKDKNWKALYFSRSPLPFQRNKNFEPTFYKHIGMYAYTHKALEKIAQLPPSDLEQTEQLEQLRWLENGLAIHLAETNLETHSIDVPEDLKKIKSLLD